VNPSTRNYSIIGGSVSAFILFLIVFFLPQTPNEPIIPIGEQIISNQTDDNDGSRQENPDNDLQGMLSNDIVEEIVVEGVEPIVLLESSTSNVRSSRSGGGGGGSDDSGGSDNDETGSLSYLLRLFEGEQESDGIIDLGQEISAVASTRDTSIDQVIFRWIDPSNDIVETAAVPLNLGSSKASFEPDKLGTWIVEADFGNGEVVQKTLDISFIVIPESPIGIIALLGSAVATLGAYALLRGQR
jgi:hypothetical protein